MNESNLHEAHQTTFRSTCDLLTPLRCSYVSLLLHSNDQRNCNYVHWSFSASHISPLFTLFLSFFLLFLKKNHQEVQALKRLIQGQFLSGLFIFTIAIWGTPAHCGLCSNSLSSCNSRRWSLLALWSSLGVDFLTFVTFFLIWNFLRWLYHDTIVLLLDDFACSKVIWLSTPSFICICHRFYLLFQSRSRSHHHLP